jgi:hypothetical protein
MPPRDDLFEQFGPVLLEAMFMVLLDQINDLRPGQGKPLLTVQDLISGASNHVQSLSLYDWMSEPLS